MSKTSVKNSKEITLNGKSILMEALPYKNTEIISIGKVFRMARLKSEWDCDVDDPEELISLIRKNKMGSDILTFVQRIPDTEPHFKYLMEKDNAAVLSISTFDEWFYQQVKKQARNKAKKAENKGVVVREVEYNDEFIHGIMNIYNETQIRQGRRFWHYDKDFETVKKANATYNDRAFIVGAYYKDELIGYLKVVRTDKFARTMGILSMIKYRDLAPNNALMKKAVELCAEKKIPYLLYGKFEYGNKGVDSLADFKKYNGFRKMDFPRYYIPLTFFGKIILMTNLHKGIRSLVPSPMYVLLHKIRLSIYAKTSKLKGRDKGKQPSGDNLDDRKD